jgi:hypothetical protein
LACPRKIGTNWFIPALVKRRFGEVGIKLAEGTMVWLFPRKNSKYPFLTSADFIELIDDHIVRHLPPQAPVDRRLAEHHPHEKLSLSSSTGIISP